MGERQVEEDPFQATSGRIFLQRCLVSGDRVAVGARREEAVASLEPGGASQEDATDSRQSESPRRGRR